MEQWKRVKGFPQYECSNLGNVRMTSDKSPVEWKVNGKPNSNSLKISNFTKTKMMRENWKFEFIKDLQDDEECKEITGHPGYYITTKGRVWSMREYKWMSGVKKKTGNGYYNGVDYNRYINIQSSPIGVKGVRKGYTISRLVGMMFLPDFDPSLEVLHINEELPDDMINCLDNLEMGTHQENCQQRKPKGRHYMT